MMGRRGRLAVVVHAEAARLVAPAGLDRQTAKVFAQIVASCPRGHFVASDTVLLVEYCRAARLAERADRELRRSGPVVGGKPSPWVTVQEKAVRALVALSLRLRLSPSARTDPKTTGKRAHGPRPSIYDDMREEMDHA
jgi:phage terminase small subunit